MFYRKYYSEVGKLIYAIANADGKITEKEKQTLKEMVRKELVPAEKHVDSFGTDAAYYVEIEFDILEENIPDVEPAFESFLFFIENHYSAIDSSMRQGTLKLSEAMASIYVKKNKKVKALMEQLKKKFNALPASSH